MVVADEPAARGEGLPTTHAEAHWREPKSLLVLWAGILLGPLGWAINLQGNYTLATFACEGWWPLVLHGLTIGCLAIAGAGLWLAWGSWRALENTPDHTDTHFGHRISRSRFMAGSGVVMSAFFALGIAAQWIPTFIIAPCRY